MQTCDASLGLEQAHIWRELSGCAVGVMQQARLEGCIVPGTRDEARSQGVPAPALQGLHPPPELLVGDQALVSQDLPQASQTESVKICPSGQAPPSAERMCMADSCMQGIRHTDPELCLTHCMSTNGVLQALGAYYDDLPS